MASPIQQESDGRAGAAVAAALALAAVLGPFFGEAWRGAAQVLSGLASAAGLWFALAAHRRAKGAEARAAEAEQRAAEAHEWDRAEREQAAKEAEARRPVEEWAAAKRAEHGSGNWFPIEEPDWEMAHAAQRIGLGEAEGVLGYERVGRARIY